MSSRCVMLGAEEILTRLEETRALILAVRKDVLPSDIEIVTTTKHTYCDQCIELEGNEPVVVVDGRIYKKATAQEMMDLLLTTYPVGDRSY